MTEADVQKLAAENLALALDNRDLRGRLQRIRAAAESDADLRPLDALRGFLLAEADVPKDLPVAVLTRRRP